MPDGLGGKKGRDEKEKEVSEAKKSNKKCLTAMYESQSKSVLPLLFRLLSVIRKVCQLKWHISCTSTRP